MATPQHTQDPVRPMNAFQASHSMADARTDRSFAPRFGSQFHSDADDVFVTPHVLKTKHARAINKWPWVVSICDTPPQIDCCLAPSRFTLLRVFGSRYEDPTPVHKRHSLDTTHNHVSTTVCKHTVGATTSSDRQRSRFYQKQPSPSSCGLAYSPCLFLTP